MRYDEIVTRVARLATAALLAFAMMSAPLVSDWCAITCEAARTVATGAAPSCHHVNIPTPRMTDVPAPCSHDHHPIVVDTAMTTKIVLQAPVAVMFLVTDVVRSVSPAAPLGTAFGRDVTPSPPLPLALALTLRV